MDLHNPFYIDLLLSIVPSQALNSTSFYFVLSKIKLQSSGITLEILWCEFCVPFRIEIFSSLYKLSIFFHHFFIYTFGHKTVFYPLLFIFQNILCSVVFSPNILRLLKNFYTVISVVSKELNE